VFLESLPVTLLLLIVVLVFGGWLRLAAASSPLEFTR